jgi:hypothetical protein
MEKEYLIIDKHITKNGITTEMKECDGKILIKHFSGTNTENFIIKKFNGKQLQFSFFKLNGVYYVNLNGCHIIDYKRFVNIQQILQIDDNVKIKNSSIADIILLNCDVDVLHKALTTMADWMKAKQTIFNEFLYYFFH